MILGYQALRIEAPGRHVVSGEYKNELAAAMLELKPRNGARLVLFGAELGELAERERRALVGRVGFVPADGGLMSTLNAWENISLPVAYHARERLAGALAEVQELLRELGGVEERFLAKLPEDMTLYERRLAAYIRALLERPLLLLVDDLAAGLGPAKRARVARFPAVYQARCPGGTYVQFEA